MALKLLPSQPEILLIWTHSTKAPLFVIPWLSWKCVITKIAVSNQHTLYAIVREYSHDMDLHTYKEIRYDLDWQHQHYALIKHMRQLQQDIFVGRAVLHSENGKKQADPTLAQSMTKGKSLKKMSSLIWTDKALEMNADKFNVVIRCYNITTQIDSVPHFIQNEMPVQNYHRIVPS